MIAPLIVSLAVSLALTVVLEAGFFLLSGKRNRKDLLLVIPVNVLTNPLVVLLYWLAVIYARWNPYAAMIPLELFAVLAEGYCYKRYGREFPRPYIFSAAANMFSFGTGVLLQRIF